MLQEKLFLLNVIHWPLPLVWFLRVMFIYRFYSIIYEYQVEGEVYWWGNHQLEREQRWRAGVFWYFTRVFSKTFLLTNNIIGQVFYAICHAESIPGLPSVGMQCCEEKIGGSLCIYSINLTVLIKPNTCFPFLLVGVIKNLHWKPAPLLLHSVIAGKQIS